MKTLLVVLFFAISAFSQETTSPTLPHGACGAPNVNFETDTSSAQAPVQPEAGKALVYVVEDYPKIEPSIGAPTIRVGMDGNWLGATHGSSYLFFMVDPGEHHLCVKWQSHLGRLSKLESFVHVNAEAGKTYYFRTRAVDQHPVTLFLDLDAVDPDEGQYLVATSPLISSREKK